MSGLSNDTSAITEFDLGVLVGLPVDEARRSVEQAGGTLRPVAPNQAVTLDYRAERVTVLVEDGVVTRAVGRG